MSMQMRAELGRNAVIDPTGQYRWMLSREWARAPRCWATFIMLNPSIADADVDDPTIRRCIGFAKSWNCDALYVVNLYALRSTDPKALWTHPDPVGPANDRWIRHAVAKARSLDGPVVAAWGSHAKQDRVQDVLALLGMSNVQALGLTKTGAPRHPLYMPANAPLIPFGVTS